MRHLPHVLLGFSKDSMKRFPTHKTCFEQGERTSFCDETKIGSHTVALTNLSKSY